VGKAEDGREIVVFVGGRWVFKREVGMKFSNSYMAKSAKSAEVVPANGGELRHLYKCLNACAGGREGCYKKIKGLC